LAISAACGMAALLGSPARSTADCTCPHTMRRAQESSLPESTACNDQQQG
jgi:hypothetical protein